MTNPKYQPAEILRSKRWESQPDFDNLIRDIDISSLKFLKSKYLKEVKQYDNDIRNLSDEAFNDLITKRQRLLMLDEEIEKRIHDTVLLDEKDIHFTDNYDMVVSTDKYGKVELWDVSLTNDTVNTRKLNSLDKK